MSKKFNSLEDLGKIQFDNLQPTPKEDQSISAPVFVSQNLEAHFSNKGRAGKTVTILKGFSGSPSEIKNLAKTLKNKVGVGGSIKNGEIIFAKLNLQGKEYPLYKFKSKDLTDYFDERGQSVKKTLMKTPINGARLSSSFGMRKHPILGFNKMHRGTDFAAPTGTPIMASGSGTVTRARWCGGGGNCVKIRHNSTYETVYAHMKAFAKGVKEGRKVKQGQIIGYVGSTGKSTGPHLHYEVVVNGKKVNSQTLKLPSGKILKGEKRKLFETKKIKLNVLKSEKIIGYN